MLNLTLNNLIYDYIVTKSEDIDIYLPYGVPNRQDILAKEQKDKLIPTTQVELKIYFDVMTNNPPILNFYCNEKSKIHGNLNYQLKANTCCVVKFSTPDGGSNWVVEISNKTSSAQPGSLDVNEIYYDD